jgi:hypothetical protein
MNGHLAKTTDSGTLFYIEDTYKRQLPLKRRHLCTKVRDTRQHYIFTYNHYVLVKLTNNIYFLMILQK